MKSHILFSKDLICSSLCIYKCQIFCDTLNTLASPIKLLILLNSLSFCLYSLTVSALFLLFFYLFFCPFFFLPHSPPNKARFKRGGVGLFCLFAYNLTHHVVLFLLSVKRPLSLKWFFLLFFLLKLFKKAPATLQVL